MNHSIPFFALSALYLDPGSGSLLIQMLLALVLGIGVVSRLYWKKIKSFLGINKDVEDGEDGEDGADKDEN